MDRPTTQVPDYVYQVARTLKLDIVETLPPQKGYRNRSFGLRLKDGTMLNFMLYKKEAGIITTMHAAHRIGDYAARHGRPARQTFDSRIIKMVGRPTLETINDPLEVRYGGLYYYLEGETIPWEAYTKKHITLLGAEMSQLHDTLRDARVGYYLPSASRMEQQLIGQMKRYYSHEGIRNAIRDKLGITFGDRQRKQLAVFKHFLQACDALFDQQALHMDFVRGNILFSEKPELHISGILDFEKTSRGHVAFDIARTLAFLLVDCKTKPADKIYKYFLDSGYNKHAEAPFQKTVLLSNGQRYDLLENLIDLFLFYDFYKFLRYNPYESLADNEHFQRTAKLLQERGIL